MNQFTGIIKDKIVFIHVPKCAGTSIHYAIRNKFLNFNAINTRNTIIKLDGEASVKIFMDTGQTEFDELNYDANKAYPIFKFRENLLLYLLHQNKWRYISGHFPFSETVYNKFHGDYKFITFLRDPVKRWISSFFYVKYHEGGYADYKGDIDQILNSDMGRSQGFELTKFIGGPSEIEDYTSRDAIDRAKRNLHYFDIVGFLEYKESFLNQFENRFKVRLNLKKKNISPKSGLFQGSVITEEIEEKIKVICRPDLELYRYAVENFC